MPSAPSLPDLSLTTDPRSLLQPGSTPAPSPASHDLKPNYLHIPAAGDPEEPLTPEEENRRKLWGDIVGKTHDLERFGKQDFEAGMGPAPGVPGPAFEQRVMNTLSNIVPQLKLHFQPEDRVGLLAAAKFIGEENSTIKGIKGAVVDGLQDWNASSGHDRYDFMDFHHEENQLPNLRFPENWKRGNFLQKLATQFEPLLHDIGPANIKLKTAAELEGTTRADSLRRLAQILTTEAGTARIISHLAHNAQNELHPFIKDKPEDEQAQIIVDYLRRGPETFWDNSKQHRGMTDEQMKGWRAAPDHYTLPDGSRPAPLQPDPTTYVRSQFEQLHKAISNTPTAKLPKESMWTSPNY